MPGHNDFSYVVVAFADDTTLYAAGEAIGGLAPNWTYELGVGKLLVGQQLSDFRTLPGDNYTACDVYVNDGDVHVLGNGKGGKVTYYHKPVGGGWPDSAETLASTIYRGTRFIDAPDGRLYLIMSTPTGLKLRFVEKSRIDGRLSLDSLRTYDIHNNEGYNRVFAVFPERSEYQTTAVAGVNFAYPGNDYTESNVVMHVEIRRQGGVGIRGAAPAGPGLDHSAPNPFNSSTAIRFGLGRSSRVELSVHSATGQLVRTLVDGTFGAGAHTAVWDGRDFLGRSTASGVYLYRLATDDGARVRRMLLVR